jgi:membrane protein involved in colicin uptake
MKRLDYDALTNESKVVDLTEAEIAQIEADAKAEAKAKAQEKAEAETKAQAKAALLERLGITEDEAKLLLS